MSKRKTESQIVAILKEAEVGMPIKDHRRHKYSPYDNPCFLGVIT